MTDKIRRKTLITMTATAGGLASAGAAVPFLASLAPSERTKAAGAVHALGCIPTYYPEPDSVQPGWPGGFFCPCHGSKFDLAGRVYRGSPAPTNLEIPPHRYLSPEVLLIGDERNA